GAVAYSCKKRGFCPSCAGKRMAESEQHLIENILPHVGYRQYVLSLPIPLRYWAATNKDLTSKVHAIFKNALMAFFIKKAKDQGIPDPLPGGITFIQSSMCTSIPYVLKASISPRQTDTASRRSIASHRQATRSVERLSRGLQARSSN